VQGRASGQASPAPEPLSPIREGDGEGMDSASSSVSIIDAAGGGIPHGLSATAWATWRRVVFVTCWLHATLASRRPATLPRFGLCGDSVVLASDLRATLECMWQQLRRIDTSHADEQRLASWMQSCVSVLELTAYTGAALTDRDVGVVLAHVRWLLRPAVARLGEPLVLSERHKSLDVDGFSLPAVDVNDAAHAHALSRYHVDDASLVAAVAFADAALLVGCHPSASYPASLLLSAQCVRSCRVLCARPSRALAPHSALAGSIEAVDAEVRCRERARGCFASLRWSTRLCVSCVCVSVVFCCIVFPSVVMTSPRSLCCAG
jgi:hypothetical protein